MSETLRVGSLCTGYAGLDFAVKEVLGGEMVWYSEFEKHPSTLLAQRFPGVPNIGDLTKVDWASLPPIDMLTAGFPCQPFSLAGKRLGEDDPRHLWPHILRAIDVLKPKLSFFENVAGLRSVRGEFIEPGDRCLCGRPFGWGGLYRDGPFGPIGDDWHPGGYWDDSQGEASACANAGDLWRQTGVISSGDGEMGGSVALVRDGLGVRRISHGGSAARNPEAGTIGLGAEDRGPASGAARTRARGQAFLDRRSAPGGPEASQTDHGAESQGSRSEADRGDDASCPSCGRRLDGAERRIQRYGMGTILKDIATRGLHVRWTSVRASDVGAPHRRERLFFIVTQSSRIGLESLTDGAIGA